MSNVNELVWDRVKRRCVQGVRIDKARLNVDKKIAQGACLGAAEGAEAMAVDLVLVEMDEEAEWYFERVRALSTAAYDNGERYVFRDPDGTNALGKYMAMRMAALADWMLAGQSRAFFLSRMIDALHHWIGIESDESCDGRVGWELYGRLAVHLAQMDEWARLETATEMYPNRAPRRFPWFSIGQILKSLAQSYVAEEMQRCDSAAVEFDALFKRLTDATSLGEPFDPRLAPNEVVALAEVRNGLISARNVDPWNVVRSIRWK